MRILSPQRLPFRHPGKLTVNRILPSLCSFVLVEAPTIIGSMRERCGTRLSGLSSKIRLPDRVVSLVSQPLLHGRCER